MPALRRRLRWLSAALVGALLSAGLGAGIGTAHAKSLGTLTSKTLLGKFSPTDAITDKFDETNNLSLAGTIDANGDAWAVFPGLFRISSTGSGSNIKGVVKSPTSPAMATVPVPGNSVDASVGADLHPASSPSACGLLLHAVGNGTDKSATFVKYDRSGTGTLTLFRVNATGTPSQWAIATGVGTGTNRYLLFTYVNGVYTAKLDGTLRLTYTTTPVQQADVESDTRFGIATLSDTTCTIDNFQGYPL